MTEKHTNATLSRQEERTIDAPSLLIDLPAFIRQIRSEEAWQKNDRNSITVFKTDDLRIVLGGFHKGAELIPHKAEGIMSIQLIEGILQVMTDDLTCELHRGQMIAIHKDSSYRAVALEETIYLLTMSNVDTSAS